MTGALAELETQVKALATVKGSLKLLLISLSDAFTANAGNAVKVKALAAEMKTHVDEIVADVVTHTPAVDEPVPPPVDPIPIVV